MKKSRFSEEQIIGILKQHEAGVKTADVCRGHGISATAFYAWKQKFDGMEVAGAARLKGAGGRERRLKLLVAELSLRGEVLKTVIRKRGDLTRGEVEYGKSSYWLIIKDLQTARCASEDAQSNASQL
jgi:putative transposase